MRGRRAWWLWLALALGGCPETVRCPDDEIFDDEGVCTPIRDGGAADDAGGTDDAGP